jgi:hypothetical protein
MIKNKLLIFLIFLLIVFYFTKNIYLFDKFEYIPSSNDIYNFHKSNSNKILY